MNFRAKVAQRWHTYLSHLSGLQFKPWTLCGKFGSCSPIGLQFTVQNLDHLYVQVSSGHKTTRRDWTCTVLKEIGKPQINK